jgi:hypothetical protein
MAVVLCTGANVNLVQTRVLILQQAGHTAVPALSAKEVQAACARQAFDVVVIGQAVAPTEKQRVAGLVREQCPGARILELYNSATGKALADADDWLDVPQNVPQNLADKVTALAAKRNNTRKR